MTTKLWYKKIDWVYVGKIIATVLTAMGIGVGITSTTGVTDSGAYDELNHRMDMYQVTDSMRNIYIEKRLNKIETDVQTIVELNRETRDIVIRLETRGQR